MSIFRQLAATCSACGTVAETDVVLSVNADRRPDLRDAILDRSFQATACPGCGKTLRVEPDFVYFDLGHDQWIVARPAERIGEWQVLEAKTLTSFEAAFGSGAPAPVRALTPEVRPRLVFGWPALREKLLCAEFGLEDGIIELLKATILKQAPGLMLEENTELRLGGEENGTLVFDWLDADREGATASFTVARAAYDEIVGNLTPWAPLLATLAGPAFVDIGRASLDPA
jgi:hypothetical protein